SCTSFCVTRCWQIAPIAARRRGRALRFVRSAAELCRRPASSAGAPWSRAGRTVSTAAHRSRRREVWRRPPRLPTVILNVYRNRCTAWSVSPCDTVMIDRCIPAGFAGKTTLSPRKGALHGRLCWCQPPAGGSIRLFCRGPVPRTDVAICRHYDCRRRSACDAGRGCGHAFRLPAFGSGGFVGEPVFYGNELCFPGGSRRHRDARSEEHTSELQSLTNLVCRLLLE